jgi:hypothetical protein
MYRNFVRVKYIIHRLLHYSPIVNLVEIRIPKKCSVCSSSFRKFLRNPNLNEIILLLNLPKISTIAPFNTSNLHTMTMSSRQSSLCFFRLLTDFFCLYTYEFLLSLCKIVRSPRFLCRLTAFIKLL